MLQLSRAKAGKQASIYIYIYISVVTCRQNFINSSVSAHLNAKEIAVKKDSDVNISMFRPDL